MLPFTKRPGRNDEGDHASKDELPPVSKLVSRDSVGEEEMTNVIPSRGVSLAAAVLPAAGRPAPGSVPPPSLPGSRRPISAVRSSPPSYNYSTTGVTARSAGNAGPNVGHDVVDED